MLQELFVSKHVAKPVGRIDSVRDHVHNMNIGLHNHENLVIYHYTPSQDRISDITLQRFDNFTIKVLSDEAVTNADLIKNSGQKLNIDSFFIPKLNVI